MGNIVNTFSNRLNEPLIPTRQVQTKNGVVQGYQIEISSDKVVDAFLGIPYAKPPINELRLKNPEPCENWTSVRQCTKYVARAIQRNYYWEDLILGVEKNEDCLYLNIFSPNWDYTEYEKSGFPVMFFIHGGGFCHGSAAKFQPLSIAKYLCRYNIIVVTIEYRLGLLGFYYNGVEFLGNYGLWDLTMGLAWIKENIANFGGDPKKITVIGHSSGAVCADLLSISPHSRDLFEQLCLMGGTAENTFTLAHKQRLADYCKFFAQRKGWTNSFDQEDDSRFVEFLQTCRSHNFCSVKNFQQTRSDEIGLNVGPVVGCLTDEFLPKPIADLRREAASKTIIIGASEQEGLLFALFGTTRLNEKGVDKVLSRVIANNVFLEADDIRIIAKELYLKEEEKEVEGVNRESAALAYIKLYSDILINNAIYRYMEKMATLKNKVYLYSFDYYNPRSLGLLSIRTSIKAATYGSELAYMFGSSYFIQYKFTNEDNQMLDLVTRMWTNFVKYGNPNGPYDDSTVFNFQWEPTDNLEHRYLSISQNCCMKSNFHDERGQFWANIRNSKSFM